MASSCRFIILFFFPFFFKSLFADSNSSFSFNNFGKDSNFEPFLALYGDAKVVNGGSSLQLADSFGSGVGRVVYKKPIKIYGGIPKKLVSISSYFSFSISNGYGLLAFVMFPIGYPLDLFDYNDKKLNFLSVEFDQIGNTSTRSVSVKVNNMSSVSLGLNNGEKLQTWIDYEAGSKRFEVRLNGLGSKRPIDPMFFVPIDLSKIWAKNDGFFVGLNGNSSNSCDIHSWSFIARRSPDWMHSQPLDPVVSKKKIEEKIEFPKESDCFVKIIGALMLGVGFGVFCSFLVTFLWMVFVKKQPIVPEEFALDECDHKKLKNVLDKASANED